jgi:O-antigen/teichoic acid export membrane protein
MSEWRSTASQRSDANAVSWLIRALIFGGMILLGGLDAGLMADGIGTPAIVAVGALICALAAFVTLHVILKREAQLTAAA